jgi:membrane protease YdiL (CAAX protease family)
MAIAAILWMGVSRGGLSSEIVFDPGGWWIDAGLGLSAAAALLLLWQIGRYVIPTLTVVEEKLSEVFSFMPRSDLLALAIISGVAEELFFRGAVMGSWGLLVSSILFALLHSGPGKIFRFWTLYAFIAGLALGGITLYRGNLLAATIAHVLINGTQLNRIAALQVE